MDISSLVVLVKAKPVIWQFSHPKHKIKPVVKRAWDQVKNEMGRDVEVEDIKKKWKNIKDTYRKELKKYITTNHYESAWKYFPALDFLRDEFVKPGEIKADETENGNKVSVKIEEIFCDDDSESPPPSPVNPLDERATSAATSQNKPKKRGLKDIREEYLEIEKKKLKILEKEIMRQDPNQTSEKRSDDYYFLMSILPEMEKLPLIQRMRLRNKINQAVMEEISEDTGNMYGTVENPVSKCEFDD